MKVLRNQAMVQKLSQSLAQNEMSNMAMLLASPTILTDWYLIDPDLSTTVDGWNNIDRYIGIDSQVVYKHITNVPMHGLNNLGSQIQYDEEVGYDEEFNSTGIVYPNTITPIPGSFFTIQNATMFGLYQVTSLNPVILRSNPFIEVPFRLASRDHARLEQLMHQTKGEYTTLMHQIGTDKSLIIGTDTADTVAEHIKSYLDILNLYSSLFFNKNVGAFVFDGLPDETGNRACYIDMTLWRLLFDERIVIYDPLVTYANDNGIARQDRIYTSCPDVYVSEHTYHRSILYRIYEGNVKENFDEYRYPYLWKPTERITKFQGRNIWYLEGYLNHAGPEPFQSFYLFDDDFLCRIRTNNPYEIDTCEGWSCGVGNDYCASCTKRCFGSPVSCINPYLRNAIISHMNGQPIDFDSLEIADMPTIENYYLIPLILGIYRNYIMGLN